MLKEREDLVATGQPILPRVDRIRYEEASADLVEHYKTTEDRELGETEARLKHLDRFFASSRLVTITPDIVTRYAGARKDQGAANGTINRELSTLSKLLRLAAEHGKLLRTFVVKKLREADPRAGFVNRPQFDAIEAKLPLELQVAALVGYILGWRKREVLDLQRRNLDLTATLRLDPGSTKNREGRVAYLTPSCTPRWSLRSSASRPWRRSWSASCPGSSRTSTVLTRAPLSSTPGRRGRRRASRPGSPKS